MKTLKKTLCLVLAVVMAVGVLVLPASAAYPDADQIEHKEAAAVLDALKIIEGKGDTEVPMYAPKDTLSRAEAAVIVSRIQLTRTGSDNYVGSTAAFSDVKEGHYAMNQIAYCVANDIIAGKGDGTFGPDEKLTGFAFAKMLLCALGYDKGEAYVGDGWEKNVENRARNIGLVDGLGAFAFKSDLTRDQAAQMAFNALQLKTVTYTGGVELDLGEGRSIKVGATESQSEKTLGEANFGLKELESTDSGYVATGDYGRPNTTTWTANGGVKVSIPATPAKTYTDEVKAQKVMSDLGYTGKKTVSARYRNGVSGMSTQEFDRGNSDMVVYGSGKGVTTEIYVNSDGTLTVVNIDEFLATVDKVNKADAAKGTPANIVLKSVASTYNTAAPAGANLTVETTGFEEKDVVRVTFSENDVVTIEKITPVTDTVTSRSADATTVNVGGTSYKFNYNAANEKATVEANFVPTSTEPIELYLDSNGNILGYKAKEVAKSSTIDVAYVTAASITAVDDDIDGASVDARVKVVYMDGSSEVLPMAVKTATKEITSNTQGGTIEVNDKYIEIKGGNCYLMNSTGATALKTLFSTTKLFKYSVKDGEISLETGASLKSEDEKLTATVADTNGVTVTKNSAVVNYGSSQTMYANASTKLAVQSISGSVTTYTGYTGFPSTTATTYKKGTNSVVDVVYIVNSDNVVTNILVIGDNTQITPEVSSYGYYVGAGDVTADGQLLNFYVDGEAVSYVAANEIDVTAGNLYGLRLNSDGEITEVVTTNVKTGEVAAVSDGYVILKTSNTVLYMGANVAIYDTANNTCVAGTIEKDDTIVYVENNTSGQPTATLIYIK